MSERFTMERFHELALEWRYIEPDDACPECSGSGRTLYGDTSTFMHGIGGQMMTMDVCDTCWGSGSKSKPWPSWRNR